ncbi:AfsR/SARP family transcriptional regulator [Amycolatopsis rubida]|uniref:AfsR/SARP family transcriptional regulator n=1 Tax=Amycolatopsis rubida TaxID=112413 RepID=A0ABX0BXR9_9PSEU|nr:BTAD domain-containing putative transcriptional regulator [Amycolatopsis sp. M39]MYW94018.1 AfsR/SARP family transcriptional regulator [Amycolatopsis rubida]NEC59007.1 AfsR/SARP family transcriptional regulator [Amycolatopsis rubida]OAP22108.1 putative HTH-type transcriptional regulator [Amycolatopsis sp. M39]
MAAVPLRVTLLGTVQVSRGDAVLPVPGPRLQALTARLALAGGRTVEPAVLVDAIWAEDPPADPAHALQALVSRLRRMLGSADVVVQAAGGYRLDVAPADVDVVRFEHLIAAGRDYLRTGGLSAAADVLGEAVALWGDQPRAEPAAVAAVSVAAATRLAQVSVEAVADLADAELSLGRVEAAATRLSGLLAEHPVHERAAALLMDALAARGRQADALACYGQIREALAETLGTDPGTALRERHLRLLRNPVAAVPTGSPGNLPAALTSFVGRDDDLARIGELLAAGRLITVLGPGGAGKTRLALEAARRHEYPGGAWLIDLASVSEPAEVGAAVLAGIRMRGGALFEARTRVEGAELDVLADQLGGRERLLLMDNCEHLVVAVAQLVEALLSRCAGLRVLATSREPLAVDGEALVPLGPLALPEPDAEVEPARRTAAVRLFAERAAAVRPGFVVEQTNLADVTTVVRGLDGLPLALELAAARLRTLALPDLAAGLSDRFRLLATGSRTAFPRHRTLRAVIAWSWELLSPDERTVAERISVLPGGVTRDSAAAVCADAAVPPGEIPYLLADLVDRSLLRLVPDTGRYRMLETIREYGLESLAAQELRTSVRDLAAEYFAGLVAQNDPLLRGPRQLDALRVLRGEYDNVLAALRHLCDTGDADGAIGLAVNLTWYWQMLGSHTDAVHWLGEAVSTPGAQPSVLRAVAEQVLLINRFAAYAPPADWREHLRALADRPELPSFAGALVALRLATIPETSASPETVQRFIDGPDEWLSGLASLFRAQFAENAGHFDQVRGDVAAALEIFGRAGDRWGLATALPLRALLRQYDGDLGGGLADLAQARTLAREFGSLSVSDEVFLNLRSIDLHVRRGETARAAGMIAANRERVSSPELGILTDALEAGLWVRIGDLDRARELLDSVEAGLSEHPQSGGGHNQALISVARGALCLETGDGPGAEAALSRAYLAAVDSSDMPILAMVAVAVAGVAALYGRYRDAAALLGAAARLRGAHDRTDLQIRALSARSRTELGDEGFAAAYERGWQLTVPSALLSVRVRLFGETPA